MQQSLTIGFDAKRIVRNGTGLGAYGRTLINDLAAYPLQLRLYAPDLGRADLRSQVVASPRVSFHTPSSTPLGKAWWRSRGIVSTLQHDGVRLFHGLSGELPLGIRKSGIKSIVTIHDLIFLRHPEFYHWLDAKIYAWKFRRTLQEADHIIAISECTRRDILEFGGPLVSPDRISLIYQSCSPRFSQPSKSMPSPISGRYILSVGSIEARKNILLAVKALPHIPSDVALVIVGRHTPYTDKIVRYAQTHGLAERIHILHGVSDAELPALYAGAEAFVYPSIYEGFGIPIIEAIGCGLPVVACTGSCLEEAGGPHSLYVAPTDVEGMADAICRSLRGSDGREQRIALSQDYIRRFNGTDVAGQVAELYRKLSEEYI